MKLLIITQKVDKTDDVLGFMHGWLTEFAKHVDFLTVICLYKGTFDLPKNVKVLSLGKEYGSSRFKYLYLFFSYILKERKNYDSVFVHMNQIYVILGGLFWRLMGKKISLWYAHGYVPFSLKIAHKIADNIFTSTPSGFRIKSNKLQVIGQGIDTVKFVPAEVHSRDFIVTTVGRISKVKDYKTLIDSIRIVLDKGFSLKVKIIGGPSTPADCVYRDEIVNYIRDNNLSNHIHMAGPISNEHILPHLQESSLFVNTSKTGSLDKSGLEAMSCGLPILTSNVAYNDILSENITDLFFREGDSLDLSSKIIKIIELSDTQRKILSLKMRTKVVEGHGLNNFIIKIIKILNQ